MDANPPPGSIEAIRRKLRALAAIARDAGVGAHEKANAEALKARLERQLKEAGAPAGDWTDSLFRLGRRVKGLKEGAPQPPADLTDGAFKLGRALRRGYRRLSRD